MSQRGLLAHRSSPKRNAKTSAVEAAEEQVEGIKPQPAATDENETLLAHNEKTDPSASVEKLSSGGHLIRTFRGRFQDESDERKYERAGLMVDIDEVFSGAGCDVPLDIANDRAAHDPMHKNALASQRERFLLFITARSVVWPWVP
ncbi:hypothetical protein B0H13DRAFT_1889216 [Mycena leptocephala]|nr:hypothetical protein B0H13DRAFT_1889216 [Mycena leptocephala]